MRRVTVFVRAPIRNVNATYGSSALAIPFTPTVSPLRTKTEQQAAYVSSALKNRAQELVDERHDVIGRNGACALPFH